MPHHRPPWRNTTPKINKHASFKQHKQVRMDLREGKRKRKKAQLRQMLVSFEYKVLETNFERQTAMSKHVRACAWCLCVRACAYVCVCVHACVCVYFGVGFVCFKYRYKEVSYSNSNACVCVVLPSRQNNPTIFSLWCIFKQF